MTEASISPVNFELPEHLGPFSTLGRFAVRSHELYVANELEKDKIGPAPFEDKVVFDVGLGVVRLELTDLSPFAKQEAERRWRAEGLPRYIIETYERQSESGLIDWLAEESKDPESRDQMNERLLNVLQWHNHGIEQKNSDPKIAKEIVKQKKHYISSVVQAVEAGWLHEESLDSLESIYETPVFIVDMFESTLASISGYAVAEEGYIAIGRGAKPTLRSDLAATREIIKHELNHLMFPGFSQRWINEALTEHIALVLDGHMPVDILDPLDANGKAPTLRAYWSERDLLNSILRNADETVENAMWAYSAGEDDPVRERFLYRLDTAYGYDDVLQRIDDAALVLQDKHQAKGLNRYEATVTAINRVHSLMISQPDRVLTCDIN